MTSLLKVSPGAAFKPRAWKAGVSSRGGLCLVCDKKIFSLFGRKVAAALRRINKNLIVYQLPGGESAKSWAAVQALIAAMSRARLGRDALVVALGGGTVTDAAGFAASIYLRGVPWVSVPTTLLGQLDGGLGGKVAINIPGGKNLVGAFHQPRAVVCDLDLLDSLPRRERVSGLAEAIKCGLVFDPALYRFIERRWEPLCRGEPRATALVISKAAGLKLKAVAQDERETLGRRELLNFGHTLGHALEAAAGLGRLRHGEAVIWGMRAALKLSVSQAGFPRRQAEAIDSFLGSVDIPLPSGLAPRAIVSASHRDKKALAGRSRFVLLRAPGRPVTGVEVPDARIVEVVAEIL